jgi:hypothetical protein
MLLPVTTNLNFTSGARFHQKTMSLAKKRLAFITEINCRIWALITRYESADTAYSQGPSPESCHAFMLSGYSALKIS